VNDYDGFIQRIKRVFDKKNLVTKKEKVKVGSIYSILGNEETGL